jgi:hypothetical protein
MNIGALIGLLGPVSITVTLIVVGLLSRRLGAQTHIKPYYLGFFAAAILMLISIAARLLDIIFHPESFANSLLWVLLADGLPAAAVTIGVIFAWRYWSWLLAERD